MVFNVINIVFFPGSYGNYFSSCLYHCISLATDSDTTNFESNGSSHIYDTKFKDSGFVLGHELAQHGDIHKVIFLKPSLSNQLDYIDNQYEKNYNGNLKKYLHSLSFDKNITETWKQREDISFWIGDLMQNSNKNFLKKINNNCIVVDVNSIFDSFLDTINDTLNRLSLVKVSGNNVILKRHCNFLRLQKNHNKQARVESWVNDIVNGVDSLSPCDTIFDEAYAQYTLRNLGHELKCYNLDKFPNNSLEVRNLLD